MKRLLTSLLLTICFCGAAFGQADADDKTKKLLAAAAKNGRTINSEITVNGNVHVQAVLIPQTDAKRIFGSEIAKNYAVVEINIGNKSPDAALIIHGVFIDYSRWPVSGATPAEMNAGRSQDAYQESAFSTQVASEEYRLVRGQLLDAQTDTLRNRVLRYLTWAGSLAGAFQFSIGEQGFIRGIAAANGVGIPGFATAFPDKTVEQLNRISDLGFRSNKVIPKQGSDVIVCFFPIDRFLTPGFRKIYLKRPALFFAPLLMLADKSVEADATAVIGELLDNEVTLTTLKRALPCYMTLTHPESPGYLPCVQSFGLEPFRDPGTNETRLRVKLKRDATGQEFKDESGNLVPDADAVKKFRTLMILEFLKNLSLNRATITLDGVMAINVNEVAARVHEVALDKVADCGDTGSECYWTNLTAGGGLRTGVIRGAYMKDARVKIAEATALGIEALKELEGSTDGEIRYSFKLTKPIDNQTKLHFTVTKPAPTAGAPPLESNTYEYLVAYSPTAPGVDTATLSADKKTVAVALRRISSAPVRFVLHPDTGSDVTVPATAVAADATDRNRFTLAIDGLTLKAGCWAVQVVAGGLTSNRSDRFGVDPNPTLESAKRTEKFIQVTGKDLIDFSRCGGKRVTFKLLKEGDAADKAVAGDVEDWNEGKPLLKMSDDVKKDTWKGKVQVFLDGAKKGEIPLS